MLLNTRIFNLLLRGLGIGLRFLFVFFIGRNFSLEMLGEYSIWTTTIAFSVILLGLDFYTHSSREILKVKKNEQWSMIRDHGVFLLVSYLLILPLFYLVFQFDVLDPKLVLLGFAILIVEHLGTELFRLFNTLEKPLVANGLLLIRSAIWMIVLFGLWMMDDSRTTSMNEILSYWLIGGSCSLLIGFILLFRHYHSCELAPLNKKFIGVGAKAAGWLIVSTLAFKTIELSDRYMIDHFLGKEQLGIFSFFYQITNLINVVIYTVVIVILYPRLFQAIFNDRPKVAGIKNVILKQSFAIFSILAIFIILLTPWVINLMDKPQLNDHSNILYLMLGSVLFYNIYLIYKLFLNALSLDSTLLVITICGAILNFSLNLWAIPRYGIESASAASLLSYILLAGGTYVYANRSMRVSEN